MGWSFFDNQLPNALTVAQRREHKFAGELCERAVWDLQTRMHGLRLSCRDLPPSSSSVRTGATAGALGVSAHGSSCGTTPLSSGQSTNTSSPSTTPTEEGPSSADAFRGRSVCPYAQILLCLRYSLGALMCLTMRASFRPMRTGSCIGLLLQPGTRCPEP